ncbi:hypothetical protein V6N11_045939 [Hibiscus sabdariffa]|uniref:Uncharacterized protein n=2 Tax=Hibiscus sabdariffa TaxID=183260 RepID=A0ABR2Q2F3_9ROSI
MKTSKRSFLPLDIVSLKDESRVVIDFIADYYKNIEKYPVQSKVEPGYLSSMVPDSAPYSPDSLEDVLNDVNECILPGLTHWQSPSFFAYYQASSSNAGLLGEMLCSAFNVEPRFLIDSLSSNPEYLENDVSNSNVVVDYKDWQITLSRRFRALKLWFVIRRHGMENLMQHIRSDVSMAKKFEALVTEDERFEIVVPRRTVLVLFRFKPKHGLDDSELNRKLLDAINSSGEAFLTQGVVAGIYAIRCVVGATLTEECHVKDLWSLIQEKARILLLQYNQ